MGSALTDESRPAHAASTAIDWAGAYCRAGAYWAGADEHNAGLTSKNVASVAVAQEAWQVHGTE